MLKMGDLVEIQVDGDWRGKLAEVITLPVGKAQLYVVKLAGDGERPSRLYSEDQLCVIREVQGESTDAMV